MKIFMKIENENENNIHGAFKNDSDDDGTLKNDDDEPTYDATTEPSNDATTEQSYDACNGVYVFMYKFLV